MPITQQYQQDPTRNFRFRQYGTSSPLVNDANSEVINGAIKNSTPSVDLFAAAGRAKTAIPAQQSAAPPEQAADPTALPKDSPVGERENTINSGIPEMQRASRLIEHATDPSKYVQDYDKAVQNARVKGDIAANINPANPTPDVRPSLGRQIGAVAAGVGTGLLTMNPLAGLGMYQGISRMPAQEKQYQAERVSSEADKQAAQQGKLAEEARTGVATNIAQGAALGTIGKEEQAAAQYNRTGEAAVKAKTAADTALAAQRTGPQPVIAPKGSMVGTRDVATGKVTEQMTVPDTSATPHTIEGRDETGASGIFLLNQNGTLGPKLLNSKPTGNDYEWVTRASGEIAQIHKGQAQAGDKPFDPVAERQKPGPPAPYTVERAERTKQSAKDLLANVNSWAVGPGSVLKFIPASEAANFNAKLESLKANIAFNELAQMREASKTGGGLGQISDAEEKLLSSALGSLDTKQDAEQFRKQLQQIIESEERWQDANAKYTLPQGEGKELVEGSKELNRFLLAADNDPDKATELAIKHGWKIPK